MFTAQSGLFHIYMFGVASNFRAVHGEAAFKILASTAFRDADTDESGKIDTAELRGTLEKVGMKLTEGQVAAVLTTYDADGNHELDQDEFFRLVAELIDGTAELPMAARKTAAKLEARGVVMSMDELDFSDDDESPTTATAAQAPAQTVDELHAENSALKSENRALKDRVKALEAQLAKTKDPSKAAATAAGSTGRVARRPAK